MLSWWKGRQRARSLRERLPADWAQHVEALPFTAGLRGDELDRLIARARVFEDETSFEGRAGLEVGVDMVRSIALQACRLILNLDQDNYERVRTVIIYPTTFVYTPEGPSDPIHAAGLAVPDGPVILAWDHVRIGARDHRDGRNVVYHEFAHKLDMLDGCTDGAPMLETDTQFHAWNEILELELRRLRRAAKRGRKTLIDHYGSKNPGEFFAESTEVFFERPRQLRRQHRRLYRVMKRFYGQNPARYASRTR